MKKLLTTIMLLAVMFTTSQAQVKLGIKGGLNVTDMSLSNEVFDADNRAGFFIGPTVKFTLPLVGLGIDASALYDQRSAKISNSSNNFPSDDKSITPETIKQQSIQIPVNLRYGVGLGSLASVFIFAGPQFGFNVGDKEIKEINWKWKDSNLSVNAGLGLSLFSHLQITANYNIACGTTGEISVGDAVDAVKSKGKNNSWQIAAAYYF